MALSAATGTLQVGEVLRRGCAHDSGGKPPHSKWSLAAILWSAGACSRFLRANVLP
ncbi:MAG TPA: hypothetical protein VHN10_02150 [Candidatus Acidoferrales bacterium]|nr:hypothetical protein [Candidatus Acidoferrales bacterium]